MSTTNLTIFNNQIENLLIDLGKIFPDNKDFKVGLDKFKLLRSMNSRKLHSNFMKFIYPHKEHINAKNDDFFINPENIVELSDNDKSTDTFKKIFNLADLWKKNMTKKDKEVIWTYFKVLIILAEKA